MQGGWHETLWQVKYMQIKLNPLKSCHTFSYGFSGGDSIGILIAQPAAIAISALLFLLPSILVLPTLHQPCCASVPSFLHLISTQHKPCNPFIVTFTIRNVYKLFTKQFTAAIGVHSQVLLKLLWCFAWRMPMLEMHTTFQNTDEIDERYGGSTGLNLSAGDGYMKWVFGITTLVQ